MSSDFKYTLRLMTNGAEVWKRWTGDRDEAARITASALAALGKADTLSGLVMMAAVKDPPAGADAITTHSADLRSTLTLSIKQ